MKKIWSISTTLRNPERLRNFLIALKDFDGQIWDKTNQINFQINLIKLRFYGYENSQFESSLSEEHKEILSNISHELTFEEARAIFDSKNYEDPAMRGRTSFKPLQKMGIVFLKNNRVFISSLGKYLLSNNYDLGELFFKSFLKWQYPNPVDIEFKDKNFYNIKPFIAILHLINEVNKLCEKQNLKVKGISKLEFEIFGQSLINFKKIYTTALSIIDFRQKYESIKDYKLQLAFIENTQKTYLKEYVNATDENLKDYADNTIRYFRLTRYIYIRGGGFYIDLEPRRIVEINKLLETDNGEANNFSEDEYINFISDINLPVLPWQIESEQQKIFKHINSEIRKLESELYISHKILINDIDSLKAYRKELQDQLLKQKYQDIYKIDEVIQNLKKIKKLDLKPSIALEKFITLALNIINDAIAIKSNSLVGDDNEFIFTAPANKPDIECYYQNFNSICEVTMLTGRDQWHNEGQPVMRHFRDFEIKSNFKDNYCIFIAPNLHRDTVNTFWISVKYEYEGKKQKIIPLTISQVIEILEFIKYLKQNNRKFTNQDFKQLLDNIINIQNINNSDDWIKIIPTILNTFIKSFHA